MPESEEFVDVTLPLPLPGFFTYQVPASLQGKVEPGQRVVVRFGKSKMYSALVRRVHPEKPTGYTVRPLETLLDEEPVVNALQFQLWDWIAEYYMCTPGEVMNTALPGSMKLSSETRVVKYRESEPHEINDEEYLILEALDHQKVLSLKEIAEILNKKTIQPTIKGLIEKEAILLEETLQQRYTPRRENYVHLSSWASDEGNLKQAFETLEKAPRQLELLMAYLQKSGEEGRENPWVRQQTLLSRVDASADALKSLCKKGILEREKKEVGRLDQGEWPEGADKTLTDAQQEAYEAVKQKMQDHDTVLLQGVTSSGKTEIYIKLIREHIEQGEQVLYLLPEIALTTQMITRLRQHFGNRIGIYHSRFSENERTEIWDQLQNPYKKGYDVILGARSAIFLPFRELGLVIVDEEHENAFKQFDPAPRYNGRDTAIMLAHFHHCSTLLGTATPAVESYYNALQGKYGFVSLNKRYMGIQMPRVECIDLRKEQKKGKMQALFSTTLLDGIKKTLNKGEQVILFQNRRGYSPILHCEACGWNPGCKHCDISLNYHKARKGLNCHYCGYFRKLPSQCEACGSSAIKMLGFGTEKVEEELQLLLPDARIARMDLDTTRRKNAFQRLINDLEDRRIDILVGTQMVTKGLDFEHIGLVGILSADLMLGFPDFRASERTFQLMAQVAGRSGRKKKQGEVFIQSYRPEHHVIQKVIQNDTEGMIHQELRERKKFHYPPFYRLIRITVRHRSIDRVDQWADRLGEILKRALGDRVLGPEYPPVSRVRNKYRKKLMIKLERGIGLKKAKTSIQKGLEELNRDWKGKKVEIAVDVDPM